MNKLEINETAWLYIRKYARQAIYAIDYITVDGKVVKDRYAGVKNEE